MIRRTPPVVLSLLLILSAGVLCQQKSNARVLSTSATTDLTVLRTTAGAAVIRSSAGVLHTVHVGDRVGRTGAVVKEIARGRMVLEETFTGTDGRVNVAQIIFTDGQKSATRYLREPDEHPRPVRRVVVDPDSRQHSQEPR